jgi:hypothetical protein
LATDAERLKALDSKKLPVPKGRATKKLAGSKRVRSPAKAHRVSVVELSDSEKSFKEVSWRRIVRGVVLRLVARSAASSDVVDEVQEMRHDLMLATGALGVVVVKLERLGEHVATLDSRISALDAIVRRFAATLEGSAVPTVKSETGMEQEVVEEPSEESSGGPVPEADLQPES